MSGPNSIILDPELMFKTLEDLENEARCISISLYSMALTLQEISVLTYAQGFGVLIKKAEADMNHFGHAVVALNNSFNITCAEIVNRLVENFASEGFKSSYNAPPFRGVHIKVNVADRAAIYPADMSKLFDELDKKITIFLNIVNDLRGTFPKTKAFWVGTSADKARQSFESKVLPLFENLFHVLLAIYSHGMEWIDYARSFDSNLPTP